MVGVVGGECIFRLPRIAYSFGGFDLVSIPQSELKSTDDALWGIEPGPGVGEFKVWDRMPQ